MKRNLFTLLMMSALFALHLSAQNSPIPKNSELIQGFEKKVNGTDISFHSHVPYAKEAIIVRTGKSLPNIEWVSEIVPQNIKSNQVSLAWIAGVSGVMHGKIATPMTLYVNGKEMVTFNTAGEKSWTVKGKNNSQLIFKESYRDGSDDRFGFMFLTVPKGAVTPGKPVTLKLVASDKGHESWTMVFKNQIESAPMTALCAPVQLKSTGKQLVKINYTHIGAPGQVTIGIDGKTFKHDVEFGSNTLELPIDQVTQKRKTTVSLQNSKETLTAELEFVPLRKWEANFMQITHTDIGYTRPQTDILAEHVRFIDYVLDYCDATDNYPEAAKFRWTCEGSWAVEEFLKSRPKVQRDRLIKRVKEGRVELTSMYFNFDEMPDEQTLAASLSPLKLFKKYGMEGPTVATQNDVNGIGWCFSEFFPEIGVKYLTMGVNLHKAVAPFSEPSYFWWESPSGKKTLAYYGEHYMHGNGLGVNVDNFGNFETKFLGYLKGLNDRDFKYDILGIEFLGIGGDNSAPSATACEVVKKWNEKYEWPKIRLSLFKDYFSTIESTYGKDIPTIRGAWPDWWTDGFSSGAREAAATRTAHSELIANQTGLSMAKLMGAEIPEHLLTQITEVNKAILFYDEHTFGFDASVSEPFHKETMEQRSVKASYAWESFRRGRGLGEATLGFLNQFVNKAEDPSIIVFNPLSWDRTGLVKTYIDFSIIPLDKQFTIVDENGEVVPAQCLRSRHDGAYWTMWVKDMPALGYKQLFVKVIDSPVIPMAASNELANKAISNQWYDIVINPEKASIEKIFDKELGQELLAADTSWQFGEFIHEKLATRSLDRFDIGEHSRIAPSKLRFTGYRQGQIWDTYSFAGHTEAGMGEGDNLNVQIRVFNITKRIDLSYHLTKELETNPEAIYVAFPFEMPESKCYFDVPGSVIEAAVEQVRGSSNDWNNVQTFAAVRNDKAQIVMGSPEIPMMQFGNINTGRFKKMAVPESSKIYSYVMNNYWTTNFNADQHGGFEWNYFMTSMPNNSLEQATKFAWENRVPCHVRAMPAGKKGEKGSAYSGRVLSINPQNVLLVNMQPLSDNSVLLHLREVDGKPAELKISSEMGKALTITPANVLGEQMPNATMSIKPFETRFVKISW